MTAVVEGPRRYQLGGQESRSLLGRREPAEAALLVGACVLGVLASVVSGGHPAGFAVLLLSVLGSAVLVFVPVRGRTLFRWLPVDVAHLHATATGRTTYRSGLRETGRDLVTGRLRPVAPPPAVGRLRWLSAPLAGEELAVLVQQDEGAVVAVLEVEGPGLGLFDGPDHERTIARWGDLLRDLANGDGLLRRLQLVERTVPADPEAHRRWVEQHRRWVLPPQPLEDSYEDLQRHVGAVSEQHHNYVVARFPLDRELHRAAKGAGGGTAGLTAVVARELDALRLRLEDAGLHVVRPLDQPALALLVRAAYRPDVSLEEPCALCVEEAWPLTTTSQRQWLDVDGGDWLHATAWVRQWPMVPVGVNFLAPLMVQTPGLVRTVAVTLELVPTDVAMAAAMSDLTSDEADASASRRVGQTSDPRRERQLSQAEQRAQDLAAGAAGVRLVGWVTVSSGSPEGLEQAKRVVRTAAARSWLSLEWCDKEHDTAFTNTLPLARGLR